MVLLIVLAVHSQKTNNELKSLWRLKIQILFTEMTLIKPVFNMIWLMVNQDLTKRTESDKVLRDKAFTIASDPKYDGYQRGLASMAHKFSDKNLLCLMNLVEVILLMNQIINLKMSFINQLLENF